MSPPSTTSCREAGWLNLQYWWYARGARRRLRFLIACAERVRQQSRDGRYYPNPRADARADEAIARMWEELAELG